MVVKSESVDFSILNLIIFNEFITRKFVEKNPVLSVYFLSRTVWLNFRSEKNV